MVALEYFLREKCPRTSPPVPSSGQWWGQKEVAHRRSGEGGRCQQEAAAPVPRHSAVVMQEASIRGPLIVYCLMPDASHFLGCCVAAKSRPTIMTTELQPAQERATIVGVPM